MKKALCFVFAIFMFSCNHKPVATVPSTDRMPNNSEDGEVMLQKYLKRKKTQENSRIICTAEKSNITVVFHSKTTDAQMSVFMYGTLANFDIMIPYFNGITTRAAAPRFINIQDGEVMKEFDDGQAFTQRFDLDYDKKTLSLEIVDKGWPHRESVKARAFLNCK